MQVPYDGAHTTNSNFPRTELKEKRPTWKVGDGCASQAARLEVEALPSTGKIVIGQIHQEKPPCGVPRPPVELFYDNGAVYANVMPQQTCETAHRIQMIVARAIPRNTIFSYAMILESNGQLTVTVSVGNKLRSNSMQLDPTFNEANLYFKAGNYNQDIHGGSAVKFYGLAITHAPDRRRGR
jgi:hypothetical protein